MPDIQNIIKVLKTERECVSRNCDRECVKCDLVLDADLIKTAYDNALEFLKKSVPVTVRARFYSPYCGQKVGHTQCPGCGKAINSYDNPKACGMCGQMVEWTI